MEWGLLALFIIIAVCWWRFFVIPQQRRDRERAAKIKEDRELLALRDRLFVEELAAGRKKLYTLPMVNTRPANYGQEWITKSPSPPKRPYKPARSVQAPAPYVPPAPAPVAAPAPSTDLSDVLLGAAVGYMLGSHNSHSDSCKKEDDSPSFNSGGGGDFGGGGASGSWDSGSSSSSSDSSSSSSDFSFD